MKLNHKVRYGIACLLELSKSLGEFIDAEFIAARQAIPPAYAHKVLQALAHAQIVMSQKGLGYRLARPLANITALEVIEALTISAGTDTVIAGPGDAIERRIQFTLGSMTLGELAA